MRLVHCRQECCRYRGWKFPFKYVGVLTCVQKQFIGCGEERVMRSANCLWVNNSVGAALSNYSVLGQRRSNPSHAGDSEAAYLHCVVGRNTSVNSIIFILHKIVFLYRLVAKFNHTHRISDVRQYIITYLLLYDSWLTAGKPVVGWCSLRKYACFETKNALWLIYVFRIYCGWSGLTFINYQYVIQKVDSAKMSCDLQQLWTVMRPTYFAP